MLLVRKRGTSAFMQPDGKIDANESALASLAREVFEELGCRIRPQTARLLGQFVAPAANEAGKTVLADLFAVAIDGDAIPAPKSKKWSGSMRLPLAPIGWRR